MSGFLRFDDVEIDTQSFRLSKAGSSVQVEPKALKLLIFMVESRGRLVERRELIDAVWNDAFVSDHVLNRAIGQLRKALADDAKEPRYIETVPTLGYRFIAPVESTAPPANPTRVERIEIESHEAGIARPPISAQPSHSQSRFSHSRSALFFISLLLVVSGTILWMMRHRPPAAPKVRSLAVLPLKNFSGDPAEDYIADGITDELITDLGQIGSLRVVSPITAMQYKDAHKSLPEIARELNVDVVVTGAVARSGDRLRIDAQLMDARADRQIWGRSYECDIRDVFQLQSLVAQSVAEQLKVALNNPAHLPGTQPVNRQAYEAFLKGAAAEGNTQESETRALHLYQQAVALDPNFARAYVGIARSLSYIAGYGTVAPGGAIAAADAASAKSIELDPNLADAYNQRAWTLMLYHWDVANAEKDYQHAIELDPNNADARIGYAEDLVATGRFDQGLEEMNRARDLDPASAQIQTNACYLLRVTNHLQEAVARCNDAFDLNPKYQWAIYNAASCLRRIGRFFARSRSDDEGRFLQHSRLHGDVR